jgi:ABC-type phosphonate transport system ATPase subunit
MQKQPQRRGSKTPPALSVEHLSKRFRERIAFDDVSFEVGHGDVFVDGLGWQIACAMFDRERLMRVIRRPA